MTKSYRAVKAEIVGNLESWRTHYAFLDLEPSNSPVGAGVAGALEQGSDDFVIVEIEGDAVTRVLDTDGSELADWGPDDIAEVAAGIGMQVGA